MSGITVKYRELLSVSIEQLFYKNGIGPIKNFTLASDIAILPTEETLTFMKRKGLIFRASPSNGGFIIAAHIDGTNMMGDDLMRYPVDAADKLNFKMILKNQEALHFNDVPIDFSRDQIYYFSNRISDPAAPRDNLHLTVGTPYVDGNVDFVKSVGKSYVYQHGALLAPGASTIKHVLTGIEVSPKRQEDENGKTNLTYDLSTLPEGKCELLVLGAVTEEFYYLKTSDRLFGLIELSLSSLIDSNYRVVEADKSLNAQSPNYVIRFDARKTRWRYKIQLNANSPLAVEMSSLNTIQKADFINKLNIVSNDNTILFSMTSFSDTSFTFESQTLLQLKEKYISSTSLTNDTLSLSLKKYIGNVIQESVVKSDLSYPAINSIDATNLPIVYSDVFLTI